MTIEELREKIEEMGLRYEYAYIGIRTQDHEFELGAIDHVSAVWVDGEVTEEELPGICCTDIYSEVAARHLGMRNGYPIYEGEHVAVIAGDYAEWGIDEGEIVIRDGQVIMIIS